MVTLKPAPDVKLADVKWRVQGRPRNGRAQFVPYVDAYIVARLLDEWVGPENWHDDYTEPGRGKGLWGHVSIRVGDAWVTKTDKGVPSNMESEKGEVSDAFKRAASLKWGVAGNVYRLPTLWAPCDERSNQKGEAVAYPNDKTIPAIIADLKSRGFTDADASEATADHDDEPEQTVTPTAPPLEDGELNRRTLVLLLADAGLPTNGTEQALRDRWAAHQIEGGAPDREEGLPPEHPTRDADPSRAGEPKGEDVSNGRSASTPPSSDLVDRAKALADKTATPLDRKLEGAKG